MARKQKAEPVAPAAAETVTEQTPDTGNVAVIESSEKGVTSKLFPDFQQEQPEPEVKEPVIEKEEKQEVKTEAKQDEPTSEEFDLEEILAKQGIPLDKVKSRIKVDGKEEEVSFSEFKKRVQLKTHLDQAGQELGRQRREIMELRKEIEKERSPISRVPGKPDLSQEDAQINSDPYIARLEQRLNQLEAKTAGLNPVIYDVNRQRVAKKLKEEGFPDFLDYVPKMETYLSGVKDQALLDYYDSEIGGEALYHRIKNQELMEMLKEKTSAKQAESAPLERPKPPIVKIQGGSQPSSGGVDDYNAKYNELLSKWKSTRDRATFRELLALQGAMFSEK